jgi:hypothetical protein
VNGVQRRNQERVDFSEREVFRSNPFAVAVKERECALHPKTRLARIPRIEEESAAEFLVERFVGVTEYDNIRALARNAVLEGIVKLERVHYVVDEELQISDGHDLSLTITELGVVGVAGDGGSRGDFFQFQQNFLRSNVAAVQDVFDAREKVGDFRVEEIMGVGNDADEHDA